MLAAALVASMAVGCVAERPQQPGPPVRAAPPQEADVDWVEPTSKKGPRLVFEVQTIEVTQTGWRARIAIHNATEIPWELGGGPDAASLSFGVMLFVTGSLMELERRNRSGDLPGLRRARDLAPPPPATLAPGASWRGTISAPGALAAGRWLRISFGPLVAVGEPPEGLPRQLLWISDNAYLLRA